MHRLSSRVLLFTVLVPAIHAGEPSPLEQTFSREIIGPCQALLKVGVAAEWAPLRTVCVATQRGQGGMKVRSRVVVFIPSVDHHAARKATTQFAKHL